jgi:HEPN domain-containing protein
MVKIPQINAGKGTEIGKFDLADCYFNSGAMLHAAAYDGIVKNAQSCIVAPTDEFFLGYFLVAFFNIRHAIELRMKNLAALLGIPSKNGHDLEKLWDEISKSTQINVNETIVTAGLLELVKYDVLKDEQLFRYEQHNKISAVLKNYPAIAPSTFGILGDTYYALREATLCLS